MKTFLCYRNKDGADAYVQALVSSGYVETLNPQKADFLLYDHERPDKTAEIFRNKPKFVYPHTPYSWWTWDGLCRIDETTCNFVMSEGAKQGMELYRYPHRIEVCGFPRCQIHPFQPTTGKRLLFAPAHPLSNDHKFPTPECMEYHCDALRKIIRMKDRFESIAVRHLYSLEENGFAEFRNEKGIRFQEIKKLNVADSLQAMEQADIIISCGTFGYLALASGKPTILYGNRIPASRKGYVRNYGLYQKLIDFPRPLECLSFDEIANTGLAPDEEIEAWKSLMIGENFESDKFISIIREYV